MANVAEIRQHIRAVDQTRKITHAMHLVASSRMSRVMSHIEYNNAYFSRVQSTMKDILLGSEAISHPYLTERQGDRRTFVVVSGDKGMAGGYNNNLTRFAMEQIRGHENYHLITVGMVASNFFLENGIKPDIELAGASQDPSLVNARELAFDIFDLFNEDETNDVYIIYTSFLGDTKAQPVMRRLLPIHLDDYDHVEPGDPSREILYEPSPQEVFNVLVPQYTSGIIFGALMQAYASEHYARMNAMESATRNADEMLKKLQTQYNIARQAAITQEITEIAGAAEVLLGDTDYAK